MTAERRATLRLAALLLLLNLLLNTPLFLPGEGPYRDSIEPGYVSMVRFIAAHPNPFGWNPMQYCGLPTHLWYLPGVVYSSAALARLLPAVDAATVYRALVTLAAGAVPVTVFLFAYFFTRQRKWAAFTGLACTLVSPAYGLYRMLDFDRGVGYLPWRMQVLVKYGEGPHMVGLALMPLALAACWRAATGRRYSQVFLAAVLLAAVCLTNWVAALATAWCCLMMLLAGFTYAGETGFRVRRLLAAAALAYLLACFWLTPRFITTTLFNWPADAFNYKLKLAQWLLGALLVASTAALWVGLVRLPVSIYLRYVTVCCWGFLFVVSWHYWTLVDVIPESRRYAPEMEIFLIAAWLEAARLLLSDGRRLARDAAFALLGVGLVAAPAQAAQYLVIPWWRLQPVPRERTVEYRVAGWLAAREPRGRVMVGGGTRFRLNAWYALPQVGGTFESGLRNRTPVYWIDHLRWGVGSPPGRRGADSILALRLAGAEYIAVHGPASREHFRDLRQPEQFRGLLPVVYEDGDDAIYRLPFTGLAHLVRPEEMPAVRPVESQIRRAEPYVNALDDTARPSLETAWQGPSRLQIRGPVPPGMLVSALVSYDGGWRATQDGQPLAVGHDAMDYILLQPRPAAATSITLEYHPTREHVAMTALSALAWLAALAAWWRERRRGGPLADARGSVTEPRP